MEYIYIYIHTHMIYIYICIYNIYYIYYIYIYIRIPPIKRLHSGHTTTELGRPEGAPRGPLRLM